jgi:tetratricopeptide (TPR) repeat protein
MPEYAEGTEVAGRFVILDRIGEGGMGAVYRSLQTSLDREVALKVLHSKVAFTPRARRRFGREARAVARLNHPHIAAVYDFGTDNDGQTLWLAMELVEGKPMTYLKREDVDSLRLMSLTDQVCSALSAAHARGIIHRDLKPSNILLASDVSGNELIKLVDFGLAATHTGDLSLENAPGGLGDEASEAKSRTIMGTPRYMAPEIFRRQPVDPRVDIYALGVILFEIVAGRPPYPGDDPRVVMKGHLKKPIPRLEPRGAPLPPEFERCIYRMLAKDPSERYQNANEVRDELQAIINTYSYVPWMTGPTVGDVSRMGVGGGNLSRPGFLSGFGGQTMPPAAMFANRSGPGAIGNQSAPLVGRVNERRIIEQHIRQATYEGIGGIITIEGEEGIGKSRLVQWIKVRVEEAGLLYPAGGEYGRQSGGFDGIRSVLEDLLGTADATYDEIEAIVTSRLRGDFDHDEISTIVQLLKPGSENALFDKTGPKDDHRAARQERVFAVIERVLRRAAEIRPVLLTLENLHHAGDATFAFLEHLAVGLHFNTAPILMIATLRSEELDARPRLREALHRLSRFGTDVIRLRLDRISEEEATQLVQKMVPVEPDVAERIASRSGGNPLHLTQILRYLHESGKLRFMNGSWRIEDGVDIGREVPEELGDLMRLRAERAAVRYHDEKAVKNILERAAILGNRFDYRLLLTFLHAEDSDYVDELDEILEFLVREGILREVGNSAEDILEFSHVVMRDVLLVDLEERRSLRDLHRVAAEVKVEFYGSRARQHALEIAEHYRRARDPKGVYVYTVSAARAAMTASDLKSAIRLYREARDIAEREEGFDDPLEEERGFQRVSTIMQGDEVALEVAHLEVKVGEYAIAREHYRGLLRSPKRTVAVWARWGLGDLALKQGELDEAVGWFEAALREARAMAEDASLEEAAHEVESYAMAGVGRVAYLRGDYIGADESLTAALENAQGYGLRQLEGQVLRTLSDVVWSRGDTDKAEVYRRRATILAESSDDREAMAHAQLHSAEYHSAVGQPSRAEKEANSAREIFDELGKRHAIAHCLLVLGRIAWARGDYKEAAGHFREAHRLYEAFEDRRGVTHCKRHLARLAFSIQKHKEAHTLLRDALEGYRTMGDRIGIARCKLLLGRLDQQRGRAVEGVFDSIATELARLGDHRGAVCAIALYAATLEAQGDFETVDQLIDTLLSRIRDMAVTDESLAAALDNLSGLMAERRPELAMEIDALAEETWQRLGRNVRVTA